MKYVLISCVVLMLPFSVFSQTTEEVIVSVSKIFNNQREIPAAISIFGSDYLQDANINGLETLNQHIPSLTIQQNRSPFDSAFRLRGIGNDGNIPNFEPSVAYYVDGALRVRSGLGMGDLLEIEQIEVLKGPQSTLYGKQATAGVIYVTSPAPSTDYTAVAEITLGRFKERRVRGAISGPLTDNSGYRISLLSDQRDGWLKNSFGSGDANETAHQAARMQYQYKTDFTSLRIIGSLSDKDMICCSPDAEWSSTGRSAFEAATGGQPPNDLDGQNKRISYSMPHNFDGQTKDLIVQAEFALPTAKLVSITSYDEYDYIIRSESSYSELDLILQRDHQLGDTLTQEIRLEGEKPFQWLLGVYFLDLHFERSALDQPLITAGQDWPSAGPALASVASPTTGLVFNNTNAGDQTFFRSTTDTDHLSIFAQLSHQLSESLTITAGGRYSEEDKAFQLFQNSTDINGTPLAEFSADSDSSNDTRIFSLFNTILGASGDLGNASAHRNTDASTWNISANYKLSADSSLYATLSHGFKSGGYNGAWGKFTASAPEDPADREFQDEEVDHFEIGLKTSLLNQRLTLTAAAFDTEYTNLQAAAFTGLSFVVSNAEKATLQGIEVEGNARLNDNLTLYFAATSLDTKYNDFKTGRCGDRQMGLNCIGFPLPLTPDLQAHLGALHTTTIGDGKLYFRFDLSYSDGYFASTDFLPGTEQEAYTIGNINIGWKQNKYDIAFWVNNASDETYQVFAAAQPLFGGVLRYFNEPRTYGATIRVRY